MLTHFQQYAEPSLASNLATAQLESIISVRVGYFAPMLRIAESRVRSACLRWDMGRAKLPSMCTIAHTRLS